MANTRIAQQVLRCMPNKSDRGTNIPGPSVDRRYDSLHSFTLCDPPNQYGILSPYEQLSSTSAHDDNISAAPKRAPDTHPRQSPNTTKSRRFRVPATDEDVQAAIHNPFDCNVTFPSPSDDFHVVRRFLFHVLTDARWTISQQCPSAVRATVASWVGSGHWFRHLYLNAGLDELCPTYYEYPAGRSIREEPIPRRFRKLVASCVSQAVEGHLGPVKRTATEPLVSSVELRDDAPCSDEEPLTSRTPAIGSNSLGHRKRFNFLDDRQSRNKSQALPLRSRNRTSVVWKRVKNSVHNYFRAPQTSKYSRDCNGAHRYLRLTPSEEIWRDLQKRVYVPLPDEEAEQPNKEIDHGTPEFGLVVETRPQVSDLPDVHGSKTARPTSSRYSRSPSGRSCTQDPCPDIHHVSQESPAQSSTPNPFSDGNELERARVCLRGGYGGDEEDAEAAEDAEGDDDIQEPREEPNEPAHTPDGEVSSEVEKEMPPLDDITRPITKQTTLQKGEQPVPQVGTRHIRIAPQGQHPRHQNRTAKEWLKRGCQKVRKEWRQICKPARRAYEGCQLLGQRVALYRARRRHGG